MKNYNNFNKDKITFRTFIILFSILVAYFSLIFYLFYLQIFHGKKFRLLAQNNYCKTRIIYSARGLILDRNNVPLVINVMKFRVILINQKHKELPFVIGDLKSNLNLPFKLLEIKVKQNHFPIVHTFNTMDEVNRWTANQITHNNIIIEEFWQRKNLYLSLNHLLGYLRYDQLTEIPLKGLEKKYNNLLEGKKIKHKIYVNTYRNVIGQDYDGKYQEGKNLKTHILLEAQIIAEKLMGNYKGGIIVMNGKGEVLVHISSPYLQVYEQVKKDNYFINKILQERYAPGSILKIISSLVLMDLQVHKVMCTGGIKVANRVFHCWKRTGHGLIPDIETALKFSCNCFFFENVLKSPLDKYLEKFIFYLKEFGFCENTQNELPEIKSNMSFEKKITQVMMASIGQGTAVTTIIQNCKFILGIFTGNKIVPKFTYENKSYEWKKLNINFDKLEIIRKSLIENFNSGTCSFLKDENIILGGKTSTSQVMSFTNKNYKKEHSIFIGSAPKEDLYISVLIENMGFGSQYGGKIATNLLKSIIKILNKSKTLVC